MNDISTVYTAKRERALFLQRKHQEEVCAALPAFSVLLAKFADLQARRALAVARGSGVTIEKQIAQNKKQQAALLRKNGYPEDYVDLRYDCPLCRDYGFVDGHLCTCFERLRLSMQNQQQHDLFQNQTFDQFDLSVFPEENNQRKQMAFLQKTAQDYTLQFPNNDKVNLLFLGNCGLGKSFLLNCIGSSVIQRGFSVQKITANQFQRMILHEVIQQRDMRTMNRLMQTHLLLFDDLGSEPPLQDIIAQHLYALIDERTVYNRPWVMASNLSVDELTARYGPRTLSRLFDKQKTYAAALQGRDVRLFADTGDRKGMPFPLASEEKS